MKKETFCEILGDINENHVKDARANRRQKPAWRRWGAMAACLCLMIGGILAWHTQRAGDSSPSGGTLPGASEIYPTVMVHDACFEWRKGRAILDALPEESVYYGEVVHVSGDVPTGNGEFVSVFSATGQIYTVLEDDSIVYLCLTTEWMEDTVVIFDRCS